MIKKLKAEDIVKILKLNDPDFSNLFQCEIGEWVQFLMQNVENENFFMVCEIENDKLVGYIIMVNASLLPICNTAHVIYSKTAGLEINKIVLDMMIEWAKKRGLTSIEFITKNVQGHGIYGFKKKATMMEMVF